MVDRVHRDAPDLRTAAAPPPRARLAERLKLVVVVADLADRRQAPAVHATDLGGGQAKRHVPALPGSHIHASARRPGHLAPLARRQLHVVDRRSQGNPRERHGVADGDIRLRPRQNRIPDPEAAGV